MIKVVLDTNIIISAALSPSGTPAKVISAISANEELQLFYTTDILAEYEGVLSREKFNIAPEEQGHIVHAIKVVGIETERPTPSEIPLPDEDDRIFYDTAKSIGAILVTGNRKHYPSESFIMPPSDFLEYLFHM